VINLNNKWIYALFGVLMLGGVVFAISGATVGTEVERGRWTGNTSGSVTTEGGNVSGVNVSSASLTDRWASFYGNVTGSIILTDSAATNNVYSWTWDATEGGEVCLSDASAFDFTSAVAGDGAAIDTQYVWTTGSDLGDLTYTGGAGAITFSGVTAITTADSVALEGSSTFDDVVVTDTTNLAYCTNLNNAGTNYNGEAAQYEVMVPTSDAVDASTTYYFFVELN
jgi:hypothetical protein